MTKRLPGQIIYFKISEPLKFERYLILDKSNANNMFFSIGPVAPAIKSFKQINS